MTINIVTNYTCDGLMICVLWISQRCFSHCGWFIMIQRLERLKIAEGIEPGTYNQSRP